MANLTSLLQTLQSHLALVNVRMNPPIDEVVIETFEKEWQLELPADLRQFYQLSNGFGPDEKGEVFQLFSLEGSMAELQYHKNGKLGSRFVLAEYMLYCDWWEVELTPKAANAYQIVNAGHRSGTPLVLTHSIEEFLGRYLAGGVFGKHGLCEWHEEIEQRGLHLTQ